MAAQPRPEATGEFREVSINQLRKIMGTGRWPVKNNSRRLKLLENYRKLLNDVMRAYHIDTPAKQAAFLATVGEETLGMTRMTEIRSRHASSRDLYRGRGIIQLTGRGNYSQASRELRIGTPPKYDLLVRRPDLAAKSRWSFKIAGWFWAARRHQFGIPNDKMGVRPRADLRDFRRASSLVNSGRPDGPVNGWGHRLTYYKRALSALRVQVGKKLAARLNYGIKRWTGKNLPAEKSYHLWRAKIRAKN